MVVIWKLIIQNIGIKVFTLYVVFFTVDKGVTKVLLIRRKNEPFKGMWALVGGALYNDEELIDGLKRELKEKTGIENIHLEMANVYSRIDRSPVMRMVAISYIGIVDKNKLSILKETLKTVDCDWFSFR